MSDDEQKARAWERGANWGLREAIKLAETDELLTGLNLKGLKLAIKALIREDVDEEPER